MRSLEMAEVGSITDSSTQATLVHDFSQKALHPRKLESSRQPWMVVLTHLLDRHSINTGISPGSLLGVLLLSILDSSSFFSPLPLC